MTQKEVEIAIAVVQALATIGLGVAAAAIAYQQLKTNKLKLRLDIYDRRLAIYKEAQELLAKILRDARLEFNDAIKFRRNTAEADFLFSADVTDYLKELFEKAIDLQTDHERHSDTYNTPDHERQEALMRKHEALEWLVHQTDPLKEKFRRYLHFPD